MDIHSAYEETERKYRIAESKTGCVAALILVSIGSLLDYVVYPEHLVEFAIVRLLCDIVIAALLALHFTKSIAKYINLISFFWLLSIQVAIAYMIYATEGVQSSYYAGLNLSIIAVGLLLPTSIRGAIAFCLTTIALYLLCVLAKEPTIDKTLLFNNLYFLILTSIICIMSVYFNVRRRFSEFRLSYEIDAQNKKLSEVDKLKSNFFANISHELRTPLTLILGPTQDILARKDALPSDVRQMLTTVNNNALRLLKLVNDILDVARLEEGKANLKKDIIVLNDTIKGVVTSFEHVATSKEINLTTSICNESLRIFADHSALEKILINLLANAIKFTNKNGRIAVALYKRGDQAVIEVHDTGIGIAHDDLPRIFDRFRQANGKHQGTGLGLALTKELIDEHAGHIEASSELNKGTVMTVAFPLSIQNAESEISRNTSLHAGDINLANLYKQADIGAGIEVRDVDGEYAPSSTDRDLPSLLIVDDEPEIREYLKTLLRTDYHLNTAKDGKEALEKLQQHKPDLVLLDLMMPEMDGLTVCQHVKSSESLRMTKVLLLTARIDEAAKIEALKLGADDFLTKPFSSIEVKTRLANLYQTSQLQRTLALRNADLEHALSNLRHMQAKLIQSEKLNALGKMSAGLLHEINNPLNYSLTALQIAIKDPVVKNDEGLLDICQDAIEGMKRIASIITDLKVFIYPNEVRQDTSFRFTEALEKAQRFSASELNGIRVNIENDLDIVVQGSIGHITQVLINLLSNAANAIHKAGRTEDGRITINGEIIKGRVLVSIRDNGVGIEKELLKDIFDPFFTTKDVGEGMGLGLSICYTIIKNHGGELTVASEIGKGSCFSFDLRLAINPAAIYI